MKDAHQKDLLFKHFTVQGCYVQIEVPVFYRGGFQEKNKLVTDADVLVLRPENDLRWELVIGDCKTLKGQTPAARTMWLRGLMDYFGANSGVVILQRSNEKSIEPDHKLFASSLGITLLDESEFEKFDRALVYPSGTLSCPYSTADILELRSLLSRFPKLKHFINYLSGFVWSEQDFMERLRKMLGEGKAVSYEIDPKRHEHLALVLEAVSVFSISLAACAGLVFNQYLYPETEMKLDEALKTIIWGGRSKYEFIAKLRNELRNAKGIQEDRASGPLSLPQWNEFIHLIRNLLEHPKLGFAAPLLLRIAALDVLRERPFLGETTTSDLALLKLGMLIVQYYCRACNFPPDTTEELVERFAHRQSEIIHHSSPTQSMLRFSTGQIL